MRNQGKPTAAEIVDAIRTAQTRDEFNAAKYLFFSHNPTVTKMTSVIMAKLVMDQIITGDDTQHDFPSMFWSVQELVCEVLLSAACLSDIAVIGQEVQAWECSHSRRAGDEIDGSNVRRAGQLTADEVIALACYRASADQPVQRTSTPPRLTASEAVGLARYRSLQINDMPAPLAAIDDMTDTQEMTAVCISAGNNTPDDED